MDHQQLVEKVRAWLEQRCVVVTTEVKSSAYREIPDALGWTNDGATILVECKTSKSDYQADADKPHRRPGAQALGDFRYYLAPPGVIPLESLPAGWGLLEVGPRGGIRLKKKPRRVRHEHVNRAHEGNILVSCLRRLNIREAQGVSVRVFEIPTKSRATLSVLQEETSEH